MSYQEQYNGPKNFQEQVFLARCYRLQGRLDSAKEILDLDLFPKNHNSWPEGFVLQERSEWLEYTQQYRQSEVIRKKAAQSFSDCDAKNRSQTLF